MCDVAQSTHFSLYFNPGSIQGPDTSYSGSGGADRTSKLNLRRRSHRNHGTRQTSSTWGQVQGAGSSVDLPPVASGSKIPLENSDSATSPGAESDPYRSFPDTSADTNGATSGDAQVSTHRTRSRLSVMMVHSPEPY